MMFLIQRQMSKLDGEVTIEYCVLFFTDLDDEYGMVGNGWCRAQCKDGGYSCKVNGYRKDSSSYDECKITCNDESACNGFAVSDSSYGYPNRCYVYGDEAKFSQTITNSNDWTKYLRYPEDIKTIFKIESSGGVDQKVRCFKRIRKEDQPKGKYR